MTRVFTPDQVEAGNKNLDKLVGILHEAHNPYIQYRFFADGYECRSPACALGHWACATLPLEGRWEYCLDGEGPQKDFALTRAEEDELFGGCGCNDAREAVDAADYIENFVRARRGLR